MMLNKILPFLQACSELHVSPSHGGSCCYESCPEESHWSLQQSHGTHHKQYPVRNRTDGILSSWRYQMSNNVFSSQHLQLYDDLMFIFLIGQYLKQHFVFNIYFLHISYNVIRIMCSDTREIFLLHLSCSSISQGWFGLCISNSWILQPWANREL